VRLQLRGGIVFFQSVLVHDSLELPRFRVATLFSVKFATHFHPTCALNNSFLNSGRLVFQSRARLFTAGAFSTSGRAGARGADSAKAGNQVGACIKEISNSNGNRFFLRIPPKAKSRISAAHAFLSPSRWDSADSVRRFVSLRVFFCECPIQKSPRRAGRCFHLGSGQFLVRFRPGFSSFVDDFPTPANAVHPYAPPASILILLSRVGILAFKLSPIGPPRICFKPSRQLADWFVPLRPPDRCFELLPQSGLPENASRVPV